MTLHNKYNDFKTYTQLGTMILIDILLILGIIKLLFGWGDSIIGGILGFMGVLGGAITYIGVRKTLQHRDREIFMASATEKLMINDDLSFFTRKLQFGN